MKGDFADEASRFRDLDDSVLAECEARDALRYQNRHGHLPDGLSVRALCWIESHQASVGRPRK